MCANGCTAGGPHVPLRHPTSVHHIRGDGNCLFRAFSYAITGSERQHLRVRSAIIRHMRCTDACMSLLGGYILQYTNTNKRSQMAHNYVWGSQKEMFVLAHMAGVNIGSYNTTERQYHFHNPGVIDINAYPDDNSRPCNMLNTQVTTSLWYSHRTEHLCIVNHSHIKFFLFSFQTVQSLFGIAEHHIHWHAVLRSRRRRRFIIISNRSGIVSKYNTKK